MKPKFRNFLLLAGSSLLAVSSAHAADLYWDSNGTGTAGAGATPTGTWGSSNFWNTSSTGSGGVLQTATLNTDDLFFSAGTDAVNAYAISLNSAIQNARRVTFEDGTATLSTGTLSLGNQGGISVTTGTVTGATISSNLTLSGAQTFDVATSRTLTLNTGTFTRNAGSTLNVLSTGTVTATMTGLSTGSLVNGIIGPWASFGSGASTRYATIDGSNNIVAYTAGTAAAPAAIGNTPTVNYDVAAVGTLGAGANVNTLRYNGAAGTIAGALTTKGIMNVGGGALVFSGAVTGSGELVVNTANGNVQFNAATAAGSYGLVKDGPGRLNLANIDTTYSGTVTVNGGVLFYGDSPARLTSGNITLNGGVIEQRWSGAFTKTQGSGAGQIQILGGESGFSQNGATGYTVNIGAITWGSVTFNPSKFVLQTSASQNNSSVTMAAASTFDLGGATRTILVNSGAVGNASATIQGAISNGGLIKEGAGLLNLTGTNTYSGGTTISDGTLAFGGIASMPNAGDVAVGNGTTLGINLGGAGNWTTGTSGVGTLGGLLSGLGGAGTSTVSYTGNVGLRLNMGANSIYSGNIGNVGTTLALTKAGGSSLTLQGNNSYTGGTFIQQGTLIADSANALGTTGNITFRGGTLQYTANSAANNYGNRIANSTSAITIDTNGQNVALSSIGNTNTAGLTKNGSGILTLSGANYSGGTTVNTGTLRFTGTNTYSGATTLNGGTLSVYDGTLNTSATVSMVSNTSVSILGGTGVQSTWNLGGQQFGTGNNNYTNIQVVIDGDGVAGSAVMTNVGILNWGRTARDSTFLITDGGQVNVTGEIRIGNPYYSTLGGANLTIGGGTATSTFSGDGGDDFYIGYGERRGATNNVVTINSGGVLTNVRNMFVGHVNNAQNNGAPPASGNRLTVTGSGTASMNSVTVGYSQVAYEANANVVEVTNGGQLTTTNGVNYIGRTTAGGAQSISNANTLTITGTGSTWNASGQNVIVGSAVASSTSNNNILTVSSGGVVSNVGTLTVGSATGTSTGNQVVVNGGTLTATNVAVAAGNSLSVGGTNGLMTVNGNFIGVGAGFGSATITGGILAVNGAGTKTLPVTINGGNFRNNGAAAYTGALTFTQGTISGSNWGGSLSGLTINTGKTISPGNSPGTTTTGTQTWAGGGTYQWEINDTAGTQGGDPGWDWLNVTGTTAGSLNVSATSGNEFTIDITGLNGAAPGAVAGWSPFTSGSWTIASATGAGGSVTGFAPEAFTLQTTNFANNNGVNSGATNNGFAISQSGNDIILGYTAATTAHWDANGSTAGAGGATPTGTWSLGDANWSTNSTGASPTYNWVNGIDAVFSAGGDATGSYDVTISGGVSANDITFDDGTVNVTGSTLTLVGTTPTITTTGGSHTIGSVIEGTAGLTKAGSGTLTLTATSNYTGNTNVNAGTLVVNGNISTSSLTTVAANATIEGTGTVGALTIETDGTVAPGNSPGILTVNGAYTQMGNYEAEIEGTTPGTGTGFHDQIVVNGTVDITGGSLTTLFSGFTAAEGDLIFILINDGGDSITGIFTGFAQGAVVDTYDGFNWTISYTANNTGVGTGDFTGGNDIALLAVSTAVIPEPSTALLGALGALLLFRRRR